MPLSDARKAQFQEAFEILGENKPEVDRAKMADIMRSLNQNPTDEEVKELFGKVAGGASTITCDKLIAAASEFQDKMSSIDQHASLKEAFAVFDKDNSGSISAACVAHPPRLSCPWPAPPPAWGYAARICPVLPACETCVTVHRSECAHFAPASWQGAASRDRERGRLGGRGRGGGDDERGRQEWCASTRPREASETSCMPTTWRVCVALR